MERKLKPAFVVALLLMVCLRGTALSADLIVGAKDEEFWNGTAFVTIARILEVVRPDEKSSIRYRMELEPLACIAGNFNPASNPIVVVDMSLGPARWIPPKSRELVLAVIYDRTKLGVPRPGFALANGRCLFMPNNQPMVALKDMDDPVILDVLHKMQAARPTTAPTTRPHAEH